MKDSCIWSSTSDSMDRDGVLTGRRRSRHPHPPRTGHGGRQASGAMTIARGTRGLATAVLLLVVLAACSEDEAAPSASPSTPPPTTAATTRPPTDSDVAATTATELMVAYFATVDQLNQDPSTPIRSLKKVATSVQLTACPPASPASCTHTTTCWSRSVRSPMPATCAALSRPS